MNQLHRNLRLLLTGGLLLQSIACWGQRADEPPATTVGEPAAQPLAAGQNERTESTQQNPRNESEADKPNPRHVGDVVSVLNDARVSEDEEVSDVVVVLGDVDVDGNVRGDVVVVAGRVNINSTVDRDVTVVMGTLELGPKAHLKHDVKVVGGELKADPAARMDRKPVKISLSKLERKLPPLEGIRKWVFQGLILARPLPHQFGWWWWAAMACALVYVLIAAIFTRPISASVAALEAKPVGSFFVGVLTFILFGPLLLLLLATGIGIVIIPVVLCGAIAAFLFGKVAVYRLVGQQIGKQIGASVLQLPLVALLVGIGLFYLLYMVPILGFLVWGIVAPLGFGAVMLAFFRAFRSEGSSANSVGNPAAATTTAIAPPVIPGETAAFSPMDIALLPRAGFWIRFAATFLDLLLVGAISLVIHLPIFFPLAWFGYHVAMWVWKGTTIGGVVFGLKVFRRDGRKVDFAVAFVRSLASIFSGLVLFIGFFWTGWNRERLSWHDMIAGTIIVKMPKGVSLL